MSKILKITMILVMAIFAVFITPQERASANPFAIGGALYLGGAGVYVAGVTLAAGAYHLAGCSSCAEDLESHAQRTWQGSTQVVKDGLQLMIDASVGLGTSLTAVDADVNTWVNSQISSMADMLMTSKYDYENVTAGSFNNPSITGTTRKTTTASGNAMVFSTGGKSYKQVVTYDGNSYFSAYLTGGISGQSSTLSTTIFKSNYSVDAWAGLVSMWNENLTNESILAFAKTVGLNFSYGLPGEYVSDYANVTAGMTEAWQDMTDAGLVLPTDNARLVNEYGPVTYDPTTDSYAGIDGVNVPREDITAQYPNVRYKTEQDLISAGAAGAAAGLYIDGWSSTDSTTSTYDPTTDITTNTTTSTTTSTNVTTGETVTSTTTATTTTTGDTTGETTTTPEGETPKTQTGKANRWGKLVTTKFPFSLPWDLFFILSFMNADPVPPVFEVDERILKRENVEGIQIKFAIDLSFLDPYVPWFRRFLVLGFAFFLVMNTRKLLGGAQ